mgnify:CR=1 FL=1
MRDTFIEWLILINIITFVIYALDKYKAIHHAWRIPERTLILLAAIGGSVGALSAMYTVRHKTKHNKFRIGVPVILVIQIIVLYILYTRYGIFTG